MAPYLSTMRDGSSQRPNASGRAFIADYNEVFTKMIDEAFRIVDQMDPMGALVGDLKMPMEDMQRFFDFDRYERGRVAKESTKATASAEPAPIGSGLGTTAPGKPSPVAAPISTVNNFINLGIAPPKIATNNTVTGSSMSPAGVATNHVIPPINAPVEPAIKTPKTSAMARGEYTCSGKYCCVVSTPQTSCDACRQRLRDYRQWKKALAGNRAAAQT